MDAVDLDVGEVSCRANYDALLNAVGEALAVFRDGKMSASCALDSWTWREYL